MIAAQPTKQDLQDAWDQEPLAFHTSPMAGFEEQGLSAAQWALLTQPTAAFWEDKSRPKDSGLWAWAIDNAREGVETLDMMARLGVPAAPDTLVRLLMRSASSDDKIPTSVTSFARMHPMAWTAEHNKATAPELLASPKNVAHLALIDHAPDLLHWKKPSTGNGLLHCAVLYKSKPTIGALLGKGASQAANNEGVTPKEMAANEMLAWPSTFGISQTSATPGPTSPAATPRQRVARKPGHGAAAASDSDQMSLF